MKVAAAVLDALALLMPVSCASCAQPDRALCAECLDQLRPTALFYQCVSHRDAGGFEVVSALRYEETVRRVILQFKQHGRTDVARSLAGSLAIAVRAAAATADTVVDGVELAPIPSSRAAYRRRGYDPVQLLLRRAGLAAAPVLSQSNSRSQQKRLGTRQRFENVSGSMAARRSLLGRRFVIVDDVVTTGATLTEAARAIIAAGGVVCGAATLAFTPRLLPNRDIRRSEDYRGAKGAQ